MGNPYAPRTQAPEASVTVEEPEEVQESVEIATEPEGVPDGPAVEVLAWVGEDKGRAEEALKVENAGQQRVGLTKKLKELAK